MQRVLSDFSTMHLCDGRRGLKPSYSHLHVNLSFFFLQENSQSISLVGETLETLLRFLSWIPLGYVFETKLISTLVYKVNLSMSLMVSMICHEVSLWYAVSQCASIQECHTQVPHRDW